MHGRKRQPARAMGTEEQSQIDSYVKHKNMALAAHRKKQINPASMVLTSKLLSINPDFYTLFNFRKQQVMFMLKAEQADPVEIWANELELSNGAQKKQPKSYYAWYHRQWVVINAQGLVDLASELKVTSSFLLQDLRNFHCWNYRRFLSTAAMRAYVPPAHCAAESEFLSSEQLDTEKTQAPFETLYASPESELLQTAQCISSDVSNYSAWHSRTLLLPAVFYRGVTGITDINEYTSLTAAKTEYIDFKSEQQPFQELSKFSQQDNFFSLPYSSQRTLSSALVQFFTLLRTELDLVRVATTMTPNDQSPWLYFRWIQAMLVDLRDSPVVQAFVDSHLRQNVFARTLGAECSLVPSLSEFFESVVKNSSLGAQVTLQFARTFLVLQEARYLIKQLYPQEAESPQVLLALQLLKHCVTSSAEKLHRMVSSSVTNESCKTEVSTSDAESFVATASKGANHFFFVFDDDVQAESGRFDSSVISKILQECQSIALQLADIDCIELLRQHDPLRVGFYIHLEGLLKK